MHRLGKVGAIVIALGAAAAAAVLYFLVFARRSAFDCDIAIVNVRYLKGERLTDDTHTIGIKGDKIAFIQPADTTLRARYVVDGTGLILAPGFLDTNSCGFLRGGAASGKLADGVTTYLSAHGDPPILLQDAASLANHAHTLGLAQQDVFDPTSNAIELALQRGAYGIALQPEYDLWESPEVVDRVCSALARRNVPVSIHLRYSDYEHELEGVREAVACAGHGTPVHVLHLSSTGGMRHAQEAVELLADANRKGQTIVFDFYPYTWWASRVSAGRFEGNWQARYGVTYANVRAPRRGPFIDDADFEAFKRSRSEEAVAVESIPTESVDHLALATDATIGTDSIGSGSVHPRGAGSFSKFVNDYVDTGRIDFARALYRFSTLAHERFAPFIPGLKTRGRIEIGYAADLVLWNRSAIKSFATLESPSAPSRGVVGSWVNGVRVITDGRLITPAVSPGVWLKGNLARDDVGNDGGG